MTEFNGYTLPDDTHDWFVTDDGHTELWACFKSRGYMADAIDKFRNQNPGKKLELQESTINLRFRVVDEDAPQKREDPRIVTSITEIEEPA